MRDSAGRRGGLDLIVLLQALQSVPEAHASAKQDRDHHDVHAVDEPGSKEVGLTMPLLWPPFQDVPVAKTLDDLKRLREEIMPQVDAM